MKQQIILRTAIVLVAVLTATGVLAHSKAENTTPADGATVDTVEAIEILFDDPMRVTAISLEGGDGDMDLTRETGLDPVTAFRALPPDALPAGVYRVDWRGLSQDGHPMQGSFSFTVAE